MKNSIKLLYSPNIAFDGKEAAVDELTYTEQAAIAAADLIIQTQKISKFITIENCQLVNNHPQNFRIIGDIKDYNGKEGDNQYYLKFINKDESKVNVGCSIASVEGTKYTFQCKPEQTLDGNLYLAEISDLYTNNSLLLNITGDDYLNFVVNNSTPTTSPNTTTIRTNPATYRKNSSGLSGGAIAGIVIACAVVLIIGSVIAMMMRRPKAPLDNSTSVVGLRTIDNYSQ